MVAGIAIIANAIKEHNETLKDNALAQRFGKISLSIKELEYIASRVKTPFVDAMAKLKSEFAAVQSVAEQIEQLAFNSSKNTVWIQSGAKPAVGRTENRAHGCYTSVDRRGNPGN